MWHETHMKVFFYAILKEKAFLGLKYFKRHLHANSVFFHAWILALCRSLGGLINRSDFHCLCVNRLKNCSLHLSIKSFLLSCHVLCYISSYALKALVWVDLYYMRLNQIIANFNSHFHNNF